MADVTISSLPIGTPSGNGLLPYSSGSSTLSVPVSAIFQNVSNVGIGTTAPNGTLAVVRNGGNGIILQTSASSPNTSVILSANYNNTGRVVLIASSEGATRPSLSLGTGDAERLTITSSGNVGIGTTTPTTKLEVSGDVKASNTPKAWVSFDATRQANGSPVTGNQNLYIRSSYNVTNVFRIGSGQYQVYFTNPISGDYCVTGTSEHYRYNNAAIVYIDRVPLNGSGPIQTTYCTVNTLSYTGAAYDSAAYVSVVVYGA